MLYPHKLRYRCPFKEREFLSHLSPDMIYYFHDFRLHKIVKYYYDKKSDQFVRDESFDFESEIKKLPPNRMSNPLWELRDQARVVQQRQGKNSQN